MSLNDPTALDAAAPARPSPYIQAGGGLGIASCAVGLAVFLAACGGISAVMVFSLLAGALGLVGLVLTVIGIVIHGPHGNEDTHVLAALFVTVLGVAGALLEIAFWQNWAVFTTGG
jgi:hypothetical protein